MEAANGNGEVAVQLATAADIRSFDREAVTQCGVTPLWLMEQAGLRVVEFIERQHPSLAGLRVTVLAGKGNNGGDGFVVARHLLGAGARVRVLVAARLDEVRGDALTNLRMLPPSAVQVITSTRQLPKIRTALEGSELVVDALLGTGVTRSVEGLLARVIEAVNQSKRPVLAVDLPSGLHADTGAMMGAAVRARWTVTLALPKRGVVLPPGAVCAGEVWLGELGLPQSFVGSRTTAVQVNTARSIAPLLPQRKSTAHKGDAGRLLIIGGSVGMAGAPMLAARAAFRAGAGLVTVGLPAGLEVAAKEVVMEAMTLSLPTTAEGCLAESAVALVQTRWARMHALAIGPGLGRDHGTLEFVRRLLPLAQMPMVIDADALGAWSGRLKVLASTRAPKVLTPHPGELAELMGTSVAVIERDRIAAAQAAAQATRSIVVLKGARTVIADSIGATTLNLTGNAGMATAGSGDVLTGVIAALIAQGLSPRVAAKVGVYLHGIAGDLAAAELGQPSLMAGDLIEWLPRAWQQTQPTALAPPGRLMLLR